MKCLLKYQWVKLPRDRIPEGKGVMGSWMRLASRAAFRKGQSHYCGHTNDVSAGSWAGGVVGLKSILGIKKRQQALDTLDELTALGYVRYELNPKTKKLTYTITDWVVKCSGADCMYGGTVYATDGYGFLCLPRSITERLAVAGRSFGEADAWLDLWCHTVWQEPSNAFSYLAPSIQFGRYGSALTLETLGRRWGWEKTKVWRFLKKNEDAFTLHKLPGSFGCLIFNSQYPTNGESKMPEYGDVVRILDEMRILGRNTHIRGTDYERICLLIAWYSRKMYQRKPATADSQKRRVALSPPFTRAYLSPCKTCRNCNDDCGRLEWILLFAVSEFGGGPKYEQNEYG